MTGFFSAVIGELLTGKGALGQLGLETRLPQPVINWLVVAIVSLNIVVALNPFGSHLLRGEPAGRAQAADRRGAEPEEELCQRPQGALLYVVLMWLVLRQLSCIVPTVRSCIFIVLLYISVSL